jgi:hypothetical protein
VAPGWLFASVVNDLLGASGSPLCIYVFKPYGALMVVTPQIPHYSWDQNENRKKKTAPLDLKGKRDSLSRRSLTEILQQGAGSSGVPRSGPAATRVPDVEISAKGRDKQIVRHLPEVKPKIPLMGVSYTDTPLQGASTSSKPAAGEGQGHLVFQTGGPRLAKKGLSGCARRKIKKARARASEAETGGIQQPGNASAPRQGETSAKTAKRPRSEGSTPTETARDPKRPRDLSGPGT